MAITRLGTYSQIKGSTWKLPCKVATIGNITLSAPQTIDGISVVAGDRVLVLQQSTGSNNGIYIVNAGAWERAIDMSLTDDVFSGVEIYVNSGSTYAGKTFVLTTSNPIILGSTVLTFQQVSGTQGAQGAAGTPGAQGASGTPGAQGASGTPGAQGA
jgi:hypothetical protein